MLFTLLLLLPLIAARSGPTFVGCASVTGVMPTGIASGRSSAIDCARLCIFTPDARYSYYRPNGNDPECYCTRDYPSASAVTSSSSASTPDICASTSDYSAYRISTTYVFDQCYGGVGAPISEGPGGSVRTLDECFTNCRGYTSLYVLPFSDETERIVGYSGFYCDCSEYVLLNPSACSREAGTLFAFSHPYSAASAQLTRKRKVAARRAQLGAAGVLHSREQEVVRLEHEYCPAGSVACKVLGSDEGYECIDTSSELESCGGCMYGEYGAVGGAMGTNCAALDTSSSGMGSMTCNEGRCVELA